MRVAIIHFVLVYMSGAEKVLEALCELFPDADIFTHVYDNKNISSIINKHKIKTTFIARLPGSKRNYQYYLPLMPYALEQLDLSDYDLIISGESGPTKGIVPNPDSFHVCYCHSPMRYVWDMYHEYTANKNILLRPLYAFFIHRLKIWDHSTASRVDLFIANSSFVSRRIKKYYRRDSLILSPPVDTEHFDLGSELGDYYLWLGRFVHYKRADIAIDAFNKMGKRLVLIGDGEEIEQLKKRSKSNIEFMGFQSFEVIKKMLSECKALVFPGIEDAGIAPVEAMASGRPVIAYNKGGLKDTMIDGVTGILYDEQSPEGLEKAVELFESKQDIFDSQVIADHAQKFSKASFKDNFSRIVNEHLDINCST